jgi:hypothetical protein
MAKNSITLNVRLKWPEIKDYYVVSCQGHEIGSIRSAPDAKAPDAAWEWHIIVPLAVPAWGSGAAKSRDLAIRDLGSAWGRFLKETRPERLHRAWEFEQAAQARLPTKEAAAAAA